MITTFKIYEIVAKREIKPKYRTIRLNTIIKYFRRDPVKMKNFITQLIMGRVIMFNCLHCTKTVNGVMNYVHTEKEHKGTVEGLGFGYDEKSDIANITVRLKYQKFDHIIDTKRRINIQGMLEPELLKVIDEIELIKQSNQAEMDKIKP